MKTQITVIATAILATMLIATPTIFNNSLVNTAFAKTTHNYCYVAAPVFGDHKRCFDTLVECKQAQATFTEVNPAYYRVIDCFRLTNSDKSTNNFCFDYGAPLSIRALLVKRNVKLRDTQH